MGKAGDAAREILKQFSCTCPSKKCPVHPPPKKD